MGYSFFGDINVMYGGGDGIGCLCGSFFQYHAPLENFPYLIDNQLSQESGNGEKHGIRQYPSRLFHDGQL